MYAKFYTDISNILDLYLPKLMDHKFDLYLNGHEHTLEYAYHPFVLPDKKISMTQQKTSQHDHHPLYIKNPEVTDESSECYAGIEYIWDEDNDRYSSFYKGEAIH
mgnify:CR=1 FL=1